MPDSSPPQKPGSGAPAARSNLIGLERTELETVAASLADRSFRGRQIFSGLHAGRLRDITSLTVLPKAFRDRLAERFDIAYPAIYERRISRDESVLYLMELADGERVESVYMPEKRRVTLCISSQAGCAVDCSFCFTALMGLRRNLTASEIVGQVLAIASDQSIARGTRLNIVFMGMGEPLLNLGPVLKSVRILNEAEGLAIPLRRITVSTSGVIPRILDLGQEKLRPKLAVSLNASTDEQRSSIMPLNRKYPLEALLAACREYPLRPREKLTFEYVMLGGFNDSPEDAHRLTRMLRGMRAKLNLIPYNTGPDLAFHTTPFEQVIEFREILAGRGVDAFIRISRGKDVRAACGQLMLEGRSQM